MKFFRMLSNFTFLLCLSLCRGRRGRCALRRNTVSSFCRPLVRTFVALFVLSSIDRLPAQIFSSMSCWISFCAGNLRGEIYIKWENHGYGSWSLILCVHERLPTLFATCTLCIFKTLASSAICCWNTSTAAKRAFASFSFSSSTVRQTFHTFLKIDSFFSSLSGRLGRKLLIESMKNWLIGITISRPTRPLLGPVCLVFFCLDTPMKFWAMPTEWKTQFCETNCKKKKKNGKSHKYEAKLISFTSE